MTNQHVLHFKLTQLRKSSIIESYYVLRTNRYEQNRKCRIFADNKAEFILIHPTGQHEIESLEAEYELLKTGTDKSLALISFEVKNWNEELSPWKAKQAFRHDLYISE